MTENQKNIASEAVAAVLREAVCEKPDMTADAMKDLADRRYVPQLEAA